MSQSVAPDVRWVAIGGAPFLSFLVALTGAMIARAALGFLRGFRNGRPRTAWGAALAAAVTAGLVLAGGLLPVDPTRRAPATDGAAVQGDGPPAGAVTGGRLLAGGLLPVAPTGRAPTTDVAAIQGDVPRARNLPQQLNDTEVTQNHADATLNLAARVKAGHAAAPAVVIWPENSTDLDPSEYPFIYDEIAAAVATIGRPVLVGEVLQPPLRNAGQLWVPGRGPTTIYVKRELVPFGEYIPFRGL